MARNDERRPHYWFPAKRYGWGWSFPTTWQGWTVIAIYVGLVVAGAIAIDPSRRPGVFAGLLVLLTVLLIAVCRAKGEPPRWRFGEHDRR